MENPTPLVDFQKRPQLLASDYACLGAYFVSIVIVSLVVMFRVNRSTENGYFLAGRFMTWLPVGASLFASNIGSEHFIGLAGSGAVAGIAVGAFEFNASILLQLLGWVFLPVYIASRVTTLPEYMVKRFASNRICFKNSMRWRLVTIHYLSLLSLTLYVFTKISVNLYSGIIFVQEGFGWGQWIAILILLGITALCTVTGGLGAVMYTDTLQTFIMIIGAGAVAILAFVRVGGYGNLYRLYAQAIPSGRAANNVSAECNLPKTDAFRMLRGINDGEMPWLGFIFGQTPASIWYWAADQMMVQRTLAAKSLSHAQGGCILASFFKLLPMFLLVLPGMISRVLAPDVIACANPDYCEELCGNRNSCSNLAYPRLALNILPHGARGLMLGVMLAALMSDLTAIFNSSSSLFTMDIYKRIRSSAQRRELMLVARLFIICMVVVSVLWIPVIRAVQGGQMFIYIQSVSGYLSPPIAAVYLCAILWPRCNESGAFWSLMVTACIGVARLICDFAYKSPDCGDKYDPRPWFVKDIHYMYVAMILFWLALIICIAVSLLTPPPAEHLLIRTTFWTRFDVRERTDETVQTEFPISSAPSDMRGDGNVLQMSAINNKVHPHAEEGGGTYERSGTLRIEPPTSLPTGKYSCSQTNFIRHCRRTLNWFCGLDASSEEILREEAHVDAITSLAQNPVAYKLLNVLFIVLVALTVFVYVYFSFLQPFIYPVPLEKGGQQSTQLLLKEL